MGRPGRAADEQPAPWMPLRAERLAEPSRERAGGPQGSPPEPAALTARQHLSSSRRPFGPGLGSDLPDAVGGELTPHQAVPYLDLHSRPWEGALRGSFLFPLGHRLFGFGRASPTRAPARRSHLQLAPSTRPHTPPPLQALPPSSRGDSVSLCPFGPRPSLTRTIS